jgi:enoyl-[acyl-carrier protein] reductase II
MVYPAGQGVGAIRSIAPAAEIIEEMMSQAYTILASGRCPASAVQI